MASLYKIDSFLSECCKNKPYQVTGSCDERQSMSGGEGSFEMGHELGSNPGEVTISYDMKEIPDEMEVYYNGQIVAKTSGLVSGTGTLKWQYNPGNNGPYHCVIRMKALKSGTIWSYYISCPKQY